MMQRGRSLELFFIDGSPDGMLTAEVFNWTGHILLTPRTQLRDALSRVEARYTGVYILLGEQDGAPLAYIGEGEDVADRIRSHDAKKDWWDKAIIIVSAANNLHKAHARYLEARLIETARNANNTQLDNGNTPARASLSEASQSNMEEFLDTLHMVLPALGVTLLQSGQRAAKVKVEPLEHSKYPRFSLKLPNQNGFAMAELRGADFVVLSQSTMRGDWVGKSVYSEGSQKILRGLQAMGQIHLIDGKPTLMNDFAFKSPSAAAQVVTGRTTNGRQEWKFVADDAQFSDGQLSFADWEALQLDSALD